MTTNIFQQISDLEKEGISVSIGAASFLSSNYKKFKYEIGLCWSNIDTMWKGGPCGAFSDNAGFDSYDDFPNMFEETVKSFKSRIYEFLGGANI